MQSTIRWHLDLRVIRVFQLRVRYTWYLFSIRIREPLAVEWHTVAQQENKVKITYANQDFYLSHPFTWNFGLLDISLIDQKFSRGISGGVADV